MTPSATIGYASSVDDRDEGSRAARAAARRQRAWVRKTTLGAEPPDPDQLFGEAAVDLAVRLSEQSWALSGRPVPSYSRSSIPIRFVAGAAR